MSLSTENGISLVSRVRPIDDPIDEQVLDRSLVFVINISESDLIDANVFIHYICKNVLNKYSEYKEQYINELLINDENDGQEVEPLDALIDSQEKIFSLSDITETNEPFETMDDSNPIILVLDAINGFSLSQFSAIVSNFNHLKQIEIFSALDSTQLLSALLNELPINLALNPNLKLVVIYANHSNLWPRIGEQINKILFSLVISVRIVLVVDRITKTQNNQYLNHNSFEILNIKSIDWKTIEIKSNRKDNTIIKDITKPSFN